MDGSTESETQMDPAPNATRTGRGSEILAWMRLCSNGGSVAVANGMAVATVGTTLGRQEERSVTHNIMCRITQRFWYEAQGMDHLNGKMNRSTCYIFYTTA